MRFSKVKRLFPLLLLGVLGILIFWGNANSAVVVFNPTDDTFIDEWDPTSVNGASNWLIVRRGGTGYALKSLLKFDLSSISPGTTVNSAILYLYYYAYSDGDPMGKTLTVHHITGAWSEATTTWNSQPGYNAAPISSQIMPGSYGWVDWDLTGEVQNIVSGGQNYGWEIIDPSAAGYFSMIDFRTKEFGQNIPYLEIDTGMATEDFGDAPDGPYPTLLANDGARHTIYQGICLGQLNDGETDGQPSSTALDDDNNPAMLDDEDGVIFTSLVIPGNTVNVKVTASTDGLLDAWIDFNSDGDWDDVGEKIFHQLNLYAGANNLSINVPSTATVGTTYSRFRFSTYGGLDPTGYAHTGEVEDHRVFILDPIENFKMHWPQLPDLDSTGLDVEMTYSDLADDFMCTADGPITDIHFWGSFISDIIPAEGPGSLSFTLTIYSDIPADQNPNGQFSQPGEVLWTREFHPGEYTAMQITDNNPEDWYPFSGAMINDNHLNAYQYDFYIEQHEAFEQIEGTIYWLGIKDILPPQPDYVFGWKTTRLDLRWNDAMTWLADPPSIWFPLTYPVSHEYQLEALDLAFVITGGGCDCVPGNCNGDNSTNILDITYLIAYLYKGGPAPTPYALCSGDPNCDCTCNILDITYLIAFLYKNGTPPCDCQQWLSACGPPLRR